MTKRASARPYAKALFEVAVGTGRVEPTADELAAVARLFADHPDLGRVLTHPAVTPKAKREVTDQVATRLGLSAPVHKLLLLMAERDRLGLLAELQQDYRQRLMKHLEVVEAHVTTAVPLPADRAAAIASSLGAATGKRVTVQTGVDPAIMGGVVAKMGSTVIDGSVVRQLERLRKALIAGA
jgi:F-type H+-transporting ATPase subunit delta